MSQEQPPKSTDQGARGMVKHTGMTREIRSVLATDCGSTTTKAILIEKVGDTWR